MKSRASTDVLASLHSEIANELRNRIASGEASSADISNAIKFLKDNGIEADPDVNTDVQSLAERTFPSFAEGEEGVPVSH